MNCQMFSWPLSSGARGGSGTSEMLLGTTRAFMPSGLIKEDNGVRSGGDFDCDLVEMELHGSAVASRQHEGGAASRSGPPKTDKSIGPKTWGYLLLVKSDGRAVCATCQLRQGLQVRAGQQFFGTTPCPVAVGPARDIHPSLSPEVKQIL